MGLKNAKPPWIKEEKKNALFANSTTCSSIIYNVEKKKKSFKIISITKFKERAMLLPKENSSELLEFIETVHTLFHKTYS